MQKKNKLYKDIFKATLLFGSVQVIIILFSVIKNKFIALILGTSGVGIISLLTSSTSLIESIAGLGLSQSSIRNISEAKGSDNKTQLNQTITILRRVVFFTASFGAMISIIFAKFLSTWTFGNTSYKWAFIWLSIVIFFNILSSGQLALLQGMRALRSLAKASVLGSLFGLLSSLPLYYFLKEDGIVPSLISSALATIFLTWYFANKIKTSHEELSISKTINGAKNMVKLGIALMLMSFIVNGFALILRSYISNKNGVDQVGVFQAGYIIISSYFGLIFTALSKDYYPRLSAINKDDRKVESEVNHQAEVGLILIGPLVVFLLFVMPLLIKILYSEKFLEATSYINLAIFGVLFQIGSQTMGMVLLAKNRSDIFVFSVFGFNVIFLTTNILLYNVLGISGLGLAFSINMIIHLAGLQIILYKFYKIKYEIDFYRILITTFFFSIVAYYLKNIHVDFLRYLSGLIIFTVSVLYSIKLFKKALGINSFMNFVISKLKKTK